MLHRSIEVTPETGHKAMIADYHEAPVVFVAGDKVVCDQAEELLGNVETVAVNEDTGAAALHSHAAGSRAKSRESVELVLMNLEDY